MKTGDARCCMDFAGSLKRRAMNGENKQHGEVMNPTEPKKRK